MVAILAVLLIPFFAFSELREVLGKERVRELFFKTGKLPDGPS